MQPEHQRSHNTGQMTAIMRAARAAGPKVLRVGLVQGGRVVDERVIKQRDHVSVGPSEKNVFVIPVHGLPATFQLFERVGDGYRLNFLDGMTGRLLLPSGVTDLGMLRGQVQRTPSGVYQVPLTEDSRGKIVIGDATFLFQFVEPPPIQPRPQLPVTVFQGATGIDWQTTVIAAFAFLVHFMLIGAMYSDWLDPVVDEEVTVAGLVDSVKNLPPPPPLEEKPELTETTDKPTEAREEKAAPKAAQPASNQPAAGGKMTRAQTAALSNELDRMEMSMIGALSDTGTATAGVLESGDVPLGSMDGAAASSSGVGFGSDLNLGGGGGPITPGRSGSLASIGSTGKSEGTSGTGTVKAVKGPRGNASVGGASVSGGNVSNASRVVNGMRAGFRACYQRGLQENPDSQGSIQLTIRVGPGGEVSGVSAASSGSLPGSVVACVKARAAAGAFAPPEGGAAVIQVPVSFLRQN